MCSIQVPLGLNLLLGSSTSKEWELVACLNKKGPPQKGDGNEGLEIHNVGPKSSVDGRKVLVRGTVACAHPPQAGRCCSGVVNTDLCTKSFFLKNCYLFIYLAALQYVGSCSLTRDRTGVLHWE